MSFNIVKEGQPNVNFFGTIKRPFEGTIVFPFKANVDQTCQCLKEFSMTDPHGVSPLPPFTDESDNENSPG